MTKQLDEHLMDKHESVTPNIKLVGKGLLIYFVLMFPALFIYYLIGESSGLMNALEKNQTIFGLVLKNGVLALLIQLVVLIPHYPLLKRLYIYFQHSVIKSAISPVLCWALIIIPMYLFEHYTESENLLAPITVFLNFTTLFSWYAALCLLISWYFAHQNKQKYIYTLSLHWLISLLLLLLKF